MGLSCGAKCAKIILFIFNFIFFLLGAACLGLGIWVLVDQTYLLKLTTMTEALDDINTVGLLKSGAIMLIAGGGAVFLIGFLGCCGAIKEVKILLILYAVLVGLILIIEIAGGVLAFVFKDKVEAELQSFLNKTIVEKYDGMLNTSEPWSLAWDTAMFQFKCCGVNSSEDFRYATKWTQSNVLDVPPACCVYKNPEAFPDSVSTLQAVDAQKCQTAPTDANRNSKGCYQAVKDKILEYSTVVIGIGIGIGVVELLGIVFAICLVKAIGDADTVV